MEFHVIKENDLFYLSNPDGQAPHQDENHDGYGLFMQDTRMLSAWTWQVKPDCMQRISADSSQNFEASFRYTNKSIVGQSGKHVQAQSVLFTRQQSVDGMRWYEEGILENFSEEILEFVFEYEAFADYADMFDVRGYSDETVNRTIATQVGPDAVTFSYVAADGVTCSTMITAQACRDDTKIQLRQVDDKGRVSICIEVPPHNVRRWVVSILPTIIEATGEDTNAQMNRLTNETLGKNQNVLEKVVLERQRIEAEYADWLNHAPHVSGDEEFERWYERGLRDLRMLTTDIGYGAFPVAGVPWYSVPFGRDSLITSLQALSANQTLARGTLQTMAIFQGKRVNPVRDEQPGKIMHELRKGELTRIGLKPFGPYYGTIDATPLFLNLAADYFEWTGDVDFIRTLLANVKDAFDWITFYGDRDGDGFVEYQSEAEGGISNQGWKDSGDSVMDKEGHLAPGSIALCEVQGYVYRAYRKWADLYEHLADHRAAETCRAAADKLRVLFVRDFWMEQEGAIALALDGQKRQLEPISSNMGQVLWSGILPDDLANRVINRLLRDDMNSGYGIRTLSAQAKAYNPISYHNGSIWPHDNSIIIAGMAHYGRHDAVAQVMEGLLRASEGFALWRLPELYGGLSTTEVRHPIPYPVSCSPQAWAAATPLLVLQSMLRLTPNVPRGVVHIDAVLPGKIDSLQVTGIPIGSGQLALEMTRQPDLSTQTVVRTNTTGLRVVQGCFEEVDSTRS